MSQQRACTAHRAVGQRAGQVGGQPGIDGGFGQAFGEQKDVSRAAAGDGRHRIHEGLVVDPGDRAHRPQQRLAERSLIAVGGPVGPGDGHALADGGGRVGHGTDDRHGAQIALQQAYGPAGRDREVHGVRPTDVGVRGHDLGHHLGLDGVDDRRRAQRAGKRSGRRNTLGAERRKTLSRAVVRLDDGEPRGFERPAQPPCCKSAAHPAAADQEDIAGNGRHQADPRGSIRAASNAVSGASSAPTTCSNAG